MKAPSGQVSDELPLLQDAILDEAKLEQLFAELELGAELTDVIIKGGECLRAQGAPLILSAAREALRDESVRGVQLRYRYGGTHWWDTLMRTKGGVRLVRIEQHFA